MLSRHEKKVQQRLAKIQQYEQCPEKKCNHCGQQQTAENSYVDVVPTAKGSECRFNYICDACVSKHNRQRQQEEATQEHEPLPAELKLADSFCNMCFVKATVDNTKVCKTQEGAMVFHMRCNPCLSQTATHEANKTDTLKTLVKRKMEVTKSKRCSKAERRQAIVDMYGAPEPKSCNKCGVGLTLENCQINKAKVTRKAENGVYKYKTYFVKLCDICRADQETKRRKTFDATAYSIVAKRKAFCKKLGLPPKSNCTQCGTEATPETTPILYKPDQYAYSPICDNCKPVRETHAVDQLTSVEQLGQFLKKTVKAAKTRMYNNCECEKTQVDEYVTITTQDLTTLALEQKYVCCYCSTKLHFFNTTDRPKMASLDRLERDNRKYELGNVAWCCLQCNIKKHTKTAKEYRDYLKMQQETEERIQQKKAREETEKMCVEQMCKDI